MLNKSALPDPPPADLRTLLTSVTECMDFFLFSGKYNFALNTQSCFYRIPLKAPIDQIRAVLNYLVIMEELLYYNISRSHRKHPLDAHGTAPVLEPFN